VDRLRHRRGASNIGGIGGLDLAFPGKKPLVGNFSMSRSGKAIISE
jgi:hypothetical protein